MRLKKHERYIVIRSYTYDIASEILAEGFGPVQRFHEVLSHLFNDEWAECQGNDLTADELDHWIAASINKTKPAGRR